MLTRAQAQTMLALQAEMNAAVNPKWLTAGYPFLRAVVVEGAESMDHYGWKWWKAQNPDMPQFQMEVVDIWHFLLSAVLVRCLDDREFAADLICREPRPITMLAGVAVNLDHLDTLDVLEVLIAQSALRSIDLSAFSALLSRAGMTWDDLFRQYVAKNVLNLFRQAAGYKDGTYVKVWSGREDNEHLVEIMGTLDAESPTFRIDLYGALHQRYLDLARA